MKAIAKLFGFVGISLGLGRLAVVSDPCLRVRHEDAAVAFGAGIRLHMAGAARGEDADGAVAGRPVTLLVGRGHGAGRRLGVAQVAA